MRVTLLFPDLNRNKSYKSAARKFHVYINSKKIYEINQNCVLFGDIEVELGDKIFIQKRFGGSSLVDSSFYYVVGRDTADLTNQKKQTKTVYVDVINDGVLQVLDDSDFTNAIVAA